MEREHNPEDRVRVKNIIELSEDDIQTFWITRYNKVRSIDLNGNPISRDVPYEKEIEWNFKDGFFFAWGGKYYRILPGEEKVYTRFLAEHCANHMVDYLINREYLGTRKSNDDGTYRYDKNILNNDVKRRKLMKQVVIKTEEWYGGTDEDFDAILAKEYGGGLEEEFDKPEVEDKHDFSFPEVEIDDKPTRAEKNIVAPTTDSDLQKMREEADANDIEYTERDTVQSIKSRIVRTMA